MEIGLLFSGQGAQYSGMGKSLYENSAAARKVIDEAGERIRDWCFNGTPEILRQTQVTQPCVYTVSMAAYAAFWEAVSERGDLFKRGFKVSGMAGFSLGEYSALAAAGVIDDIKKGTEIVAKRGALMLKAGSDSEGTARGGMMAAIGKREHILDCVESAREGGILEGVNFNSPVQTVVAGDMAALGRFKKKASENGIKALSLNVSAAFHSPMMEPAAEPIRQMLLEAGLKAPRYKIYCNLNGRDMFEGNRPDNGNIAEYVADVMARQAKSPVYWQETVENMAGDGIRALIEFGPGSALCAMAKKTSPELLAFNVEDKDSLGKTVEALAEILEQEQGGPDA